MGPERDLLVRRVLDDFGFRLGLGLRFRFGLRLGLGLRLRFRLGLRLYRHYGCRRFKRHRLFELFLKHRLFHRGLLHDGSGNLCIQRRGMCPLGSICGLIHKIGREQGGCSSRLSRNRLRFRLRLFLELIVIGFVLKLLFGILVTSDETIPEARHATHKALALRLLFPFVKLFVIDNRFVRQLLMDGCRLIRPDEFLV